MTLLVLSPRRHCAFRLFPKHLTPAGFNSFPLSSASDLNSIFTATMASRSPTVATPLPKSSAAPESPWKDAPATPQTVPFPPPQTFEIIPPLHGILVRLLSQKASSGGTSGALSGAMGPPGAVTEGQAQDQQTSSGIPGNGSNGTSASHPVTETSALDSNAHPPLDIKDLPTETSSVKIRIQKARGVVEGLPDVHRSVEEQQKEIDELEDRVARLRSVISDFGNRAGTTTDHSRAATS